MRDPARCGAHAEAKPGSWARRGAYREWCGPGGCVSANHLNPALQQAPDPDGPATAHAQRPLGFTPTMKLRQIYAEPDHPLHEPAGDIANW